MSLLRSSLVGSASGLSSAELRRTSMSDKQWLSISEEQLINEIFTDEFYHRLHDPANIWYSQDDIGHGSLDSEDIIKPESCSEDIFLKYLLPCYIHNTAESCGTMSSLIRDLLQV